MAERARTEFAGTLHPADDPSGGELVGNAVDDCQVVQHFDDLAIFARDARKLLAIDRRTPERMIGNVAIRIAEVQAIGVQGCAQCAAGVARRRRDE